LHKESVTRGHNYMAVWAGAALALTHYQRQDLAAALRALAAVIELAAPAGLMATLLDQGPEMAALLARFRDAALREDKHYAHAHYLDAILLASREQEQQSASTEATASALSARELSILELVGQLKSNKEISRALGISVDTVKTHMKNIFAKLTVTKRIEAARRAEALGLIRRS
jgi:ATP/maltotriose-dependent transcriptional regulator MalT